MKDIHPIKSHDVPKSGSLTDMSYCLDCGAGYDSTSNCVPDGHRDRRIQDSIDRKKRHTVRLQWFDGREWVTVGNEWVTEKNAWDSLGLDCYGYRTIDHNDVVLTDKKDPPPVNDMDDPEVRRAATYLDRFREPESGW